MENKEFDLERYDVAREFDNDWKEYFATEKQSDDGEFVRHEDHLTTIQLVADELIRLMVTNLQTCMEIHDCSQSYINAVSENAKAKSKALIQSKFTDRIWTGE